MICPHCQKDQEPEKYELHEAICKKHLIDCPKCGIKISKSALEAHTIELHSLKLCNYCHESFEQSTFDSHPCSDPPISCEYCEGHLPYSQYQDHINICGNRTDQCEKCENYILKKDWKIHSLYEDCRPAKSVILRDAKRNRANEITNLLNQDRYGPGINPVDDGMYVFDQNGNPINLGDNQPNSLANIFNQGNMNLFQGVNIYDPGNPNISMNFESQTPEGSISFEEPLPPPVTRRYITALSTLCIKNIKQIGMRVPFKKYIF